MNRAAALTALFRAPNWWLCKVEGCVRSLISSKNARTCAYHEKEL